MIDFLNSLQTRSIFGLSLSNLVSAIGVALVSYVFMALALRLIVGSA